MSEKQINVPSSAVLCSLAHVNATHVDENIDFRQSQLSLLSRTPHTHTDKLCLVCIQRREMIFHFEKSGLKCIRTNVLTLFLRDRNALRKVRISVWAQLYMRNPKKRTHTCLNLHLLLISRTKPRYSPILDAKVRLNPMMNQDY